MSLSVNRRIFRSDAAGDDVFVVGGQPREAVPSDGPLTTVSDMLDGARRRSEHTITAAEQQAAEILADAHAEAGAIRETARDEGYSAGFADGRTRAESEAAAMVEVIRQAAAEGIVIRDHMIEDAMPSIARAVMMAARRVIGAAYESDPSLTADACADAVRAAAGQQILSIRVSPEAYERVRAALVDFSEYIRPDEGVAIGGCIVDLRNGSIDATLDSRLELMDLALKAAGGTE